MDLTDAREPFQLFLEAVIGPSYLGDIAVDDIKLMNKDQCAEVSKIC